MILDLHTWHDLDKHEVCLAIDDDNRVAVLAVFSEYQIARNFREWLLREFDENQLYGFCEVLYERYPARPEHLAMRDKINERRKHPALDMDRYRELMRFNHVAYLK